MVLRELDLTEPFYLKIDGKWVYVNEDVLRNHPGGSAITTYRNKEVRAESDTSFPEKGQLHSLPRL